MRGTTKVIIVAVVLAVALSGLSVGLFEITKPKSEENSILKSLDVYAGTFELEGKKYTIEILDSTNTDGQTNRFVHIGSKGVLSIRAEDNNNDRLFEKVTYQSEDPGPVTCEQSSTPVVRMRPYRPIILNPRQEKITEQKKNEDLAWNKIVLQNERWRIQASEDDGAPKSGIELNNALKKIYSGMSAIHNNDHLVFQWNDDNNYGHRFKIQNLPDPK